jgi:hypothetical protein
MGGFHFIFRRRRPKIRLMGGRLAVHIKGPITVALFTAELFSISLNVMGEVEEISNVLMAHRCFRRRAGRIRIPSVALGVQLVAGLLIRCTAEGSTPNWAAILRMPRTPWREPQTMHSIESTDAPHPPQPPSRSRRP